MLATEPKLRDRISARDRNLRRQGRHLSRVIYAAVFIATTAAAVDAGSNAEPAGAAVGGLEEIVVTATRREESISRVPISVTAFSQDMIDQRGVKDFQDVVRFTPGVSIDNSGTNAISIRGISSSGGAGTTGIYIDDSPIQMRALGFNPDDTLPKTFDLDRVEVLRGPQGTLFGAGSEGGTVRYIMTQPSVSKESMYMRSEVSITRGGEPSYEAGIAHGGPIIDEVFGYRASVWYRYDGGWIDRIDPTTLQTVDKNANHANTVAARLAFLIQPKDGVRITPSIMFQNSRKHDFSTYWPAYTDVSSGHFKNATPERLPDPDRYYLPALKIEADLGPAEFISNSSYYNRLEHTAYQGTSYDLAYFQSIGWAGSGYGFDAAGNDIGLPCAGSSAPPGGQCSWYPLLDAKGVHLPPGFTGYATPNLMTNAQESYTQEFRLQSTDAASPLKWTVGAFWTLARESSIEELRDPQINQFFNALFGEDAFAVYSGANGTATAPWYNCSSYASPQNTPQSFPDCDIYYNNNKSYDRQLAGFGEVSYNVTDQLKLTAGGRYAKMSFDLSHHGDGFENFGPDYHTGTYHENAFTPKLGVSFQLDPENLYYATYAKGFRPGGVNAPLAAICQPFLVAEGYPSGQSPLNYKSDTTQSYEVGSKNAIADRLRIATSVYYIKWNGIQQNVYVGGCGLQFTDNLGTAVAWGGDVQGELVLGGGFSIEAAVGYTSARFTKDSKGGLAIKGDAISGEAAINYAPGTNPPWTATIGPQYSFKAMGHDAFIRLDYEYTSRNPWLAPVQDPNSVQYNPNSYALSSTKFASLRSGVSINKVQVAAFVDNLFDSRTTTNYAEVQPDSGNYNLDQSLPQSVQHNNFTFRPRTIGLTLTYRQ
ncbi:MAG TPA: TonB-dependent receptor [Steroidobacteraceae bacterium]|nr:TonB-dependent receptor [Steroidobacteraceae bacterium]